MALPLKRTIGPYTLIDSLGKGSMGSVYSALHETSRKKVALKLMPVDRSSSEKKKRFYREAQLAANLDHPHIIKIYEVGESDDQLYIAMELLQGQDLKAVLDSQESIALEQKRAWMLELTETFSYAHSKEIVHRDIKPSNVWIRQDSSTVVMDLGSHGPPYPT